MPFVEGCHNCTQPGGDAHQTIILQMPKGVLDRCPADPDFPGEFSGGEKFSRFEYAGENPGFQEIIGSGRDRGQIKIERV